MERDRGGMRPEWKDRLSDERGGGVTDGEREKRRGEDTNRTAGG